MALNISRKHIAFCLGLIVTLAAQGAMEVPVSDARGLGKLIEEAFNHHPSIAAARSQLEAAQAGVRAAQSQYLPTPSIQRQQARSGSDSATVVALQQPLWAGGRLDAGVDAASARKEAANFSASDARYSLALRVTAAWGAWLQARGRSEALVEGAELLKRYAESVRRRIQGGAAGKVDDDLVIARLVQTEGDLASARSAERVARARLTQLVGRPVAPNDLVESSPIGEDAPLPPQSTLTTKAIEHSAALSKRQAEIDAAGGDLEQKRAIQWPTLSLRAQYQRQDEPQYGQPQTDDRVMLVFEYVPGAGLSAGAEVDAAAARQAALREELRAAHQDLADTIATDYEDAVASYQRKQQLERTLAANRAVLASYDRLFTAGKRGWLDVINAAREVIQTQVSLADAGAQHSTARARLRLHAGEAL